MQCKQCLHELADGSRFCTECGCPAPDPQETVAPAEPLVEAVAPAPIVVEAPVTAAPEVRVPAAPSAPPVAPGRVVQAPASTLKSHGYRVSIGAFVLLIAVALAAVIGLRWYGGASKNTVVVSTGAAGLKAGSSATGEKAASSESIGTPKAGATETPPPSPNDAAKVPNGAVTADQDSAPVATVPDEESAMQRGRESSGDGSEELVGTFKQSERRDAGGHTVREAATVYVVRCNGRRLYVYEYLNRGGFRAIQPPDSRPIGGRDFETYEDAVREACE